MDKSAKPEQAKEVVQAQQQPYDNVLKMVLEKQEAAVLPYLLEGVEYLETIDLEVLHPPLRVDRVYRVRFRGRVRILHIEFESGSNSLMASRVLVYNAYFLDKFKLPVISIIVYPFETTMAKSPLEVNDEDEELITFHFRVLPLWKLAAQSMLDAQAVSMYGLLPTMQGASLQLLTQAIDELIKHYQGDETQLRRELLCFRVLLRRAEIVPIEDKMQLQRRLSMFNQLLEEDPYIQEIKAEGEAKGRVEGEAKGRIRGLQEAVITITVARFPDLEELAKKNVRRIVQPETLNFLLKGVNAAPDEATVRLLLNVVA